MAEQLKNLSVGSENDIDVLKVLGESISTTNNTTKLKISQKKIYEVLKPEDRVKADDIIIQALKYYYSII